jgi:hypothetical protein
MRITDAALYFAGAFEDCRQPRVAPVAFYPPLGPNTWLHRPMLRREVLTCQPGAVHTWHQADQVTGALLRRELTRRGRFKREKMC